MNPRDGRSHGNKKVTFCLSFVISRKGVEDDSIDSIRLDFRFAEKLGISARCVGFYTKVGYFYQVV
jgi:hypothetical protein